LAIIVFAAFGLPLTSPSEVLDHRVIKAQVISETQAPEPTPKAKPAPPPPPKKVEKKAPPPLPPKQVAVLPPPKLKPAPPLDPPKPKLAEKPKPKPEPKKAEKPEPVPLKIAPRPKLRPKPNFEQMMLKTVEKLKDRPPPKPKPERNSFDHKMAALMKTQPSTSSRAAQRAPLGEKLSISEIDAIKRQVERCWLVPAAIGAKDVENMVVKIKMKLNPDGRLRESRIVDRFRLETNTTFKAVAESALRAVRNPRCSTFNLPLAKYQIWKDIELRFNPGEMVGR
ncbi:MAG: hypothetical protein VX107_14095, partial [Pseudomonadota bacterium]|nr:hypothetical protein [Pseudomonadota bacterium]